MKILFLNINLNWVYNLFSEYIINSKKFIKERRGKAIEETRIRKRKKGKRGRSYCI